ncbi:MAG: NAD(P)H-dependent amine dehydrogenase family protein [Woeseiaceae bacterium]
MRKLRVIQWGTGSVGRTALRQIIDKGDYELAGVYVTSEKKHGLDAGAIVKRPETGVIATSNIDEILAIDADAVLHTSLISVPYEVQNENVARLLESGKNVLSTNGFYRPDCHGDTYAAPLREAAVQGGATLAGIGLNPGFIAERLLLALTGLIVHMKELRSYEVFDASMAPSPGLVFNAMGLGTDPEEKDLTRSPVAELYNALYAEVFDYVADKLGTKVSSVVPEHELTLAPEDIKIRVGTIPRGTVAATTWKWRGRFENGVTMLHSILWTSSHALHGEAAGAHWRIEIDGRPNVRVSLDMIDPDPHAPPGRPAMDATAATLLNALPHVVNAPAGFFDLPAVLPPAQALPDA